MTVFEWATNDIGNEDSRRKWLVETLYPWRKDWQLYRYYRTREAARNFIDAMRTLKLKTKHRVRKNK